MNRTPAVFAKRFALASVAAVVLSSAACSGGGESEKTGDNGEPTPTPVVNPFDVCVAHFEVDVGDAPEVANLLLVVLLSEYWNDSQTVGIDGFTGAIYADYHYTFGGGAQLPEYVAAISTAAAVTVTTSGGELGSSATLAIEADPLWYVTTSTAHTVTGGAGSATGTLQSLTDCSGAGSCVYGTGGSTVLVNGSSLTFGQTNPDGVTILYCRNLPSAFAEWRPGQPLPPGFREAFR